jgi:hypothetical protein
MKHRFNASKELGTGVTSSAAIAIAVAALAPPEVDPVDDRLTERYCAKPAKLAQPARPR